MGAYVSKEDLHILQESSYYSFPLNSKYFNPWEGYCAKNYDYYMGKRVVKISRSLYPNYTRGYLWGYYITNNQDDDNSTYDDSDDELEKSF